MESIEQRIAEFEKNVRQIMLQFNQMNAALLSNPHLNLGPHDVSVIDLLGELGPQMMRAIAERLHLAVNSVTPIVDSLEQRGLVQRSRSDTDRRVVNVLLSEEGVKAYEAASRLKLCFHRTMLNALQPEEQLIFLNLIRKIANSGAQEIIASESSLESTSSQDLNLP